MRMDGMIPGMHSRPVEQRAIGGARQSEQERKQFKKDHPDQYKQIEQQRKEQLKQEQERRKHEGGN